MKASRKGTRLNDQQYFKQPPPHLRQRMTAMCVLPNISALRDKIQVTETQISICQRQERRLRARTRGKTSLENGSRRTGHEDGGRGATTHNTIHLKNKSRELARYSYGVQSNEEEEEEEEEEENEWRTDVFDETTRVGNAEDARRSKKSTKRSVPDRAGRREFAGIKRSSDKASQHWESMANGRRKVGVDKCVNARDSGSEKSETRRSLANEGTERPRTKASGKGDTSFSFPWTTKKEVPCDNGEQRDECFHRVKKTARYEHLESANKQPAGRFKQMILEFFGLFAVVRRNQTRTTKWESREAPTIETLYHRTSRTKRNKARRRSARTATVLRSGGDQCSVISNSQCSYPTNRRPARKTNPRTKTRRVSNNGGSF